jgi:uncharacterized membrane protein YfcA
MDLRLTAAGFVVGVVTGMSGIGGSSLLAPILILFLGVKPTIAVGTDLLYSVPMKALAAFAHVRQGTIDRRVILVLTAGGIPGSLLGLAAFSALRLHLGRTELDHLIRHAIGIVILTAAAAALVLHLVSLRQAKASAARHPAWIVTIGFVVGFLVALTSIGSGSITLPLLLLVLPAVSLRALIGSEIVFAALIIPVSALGHSAFGDVDVKLVLSLVLGAVPGAYLGSRLCARLNEAALRPAVIGLLAYAGTKLL